MEEGQTIVLSTQGEEDQTIVLGTHEEDNVAHNVDGNTQMEISIINNGSVTNIIDASGNTLSRQEDDVIAVLGQLFESAEDTLQQMAEAASQIDPRRSAPDILEEPKSGGSRHRPFACQCGKTYTCKSHLKYHQKVHDNVRPYVCDVCNLSFLQLGHLRRHSRIHTLDKPYKCDVCNKSFRQSSHLTCHLRIHTNEKPYKCEVCSQGFRQKSAVYRHIQRMHIKEKVYVCSLCEKGYSGEADLRRHEKTHVNITYFAVMNLHTKLSKICGHIEEEDPLIPADNGGMPQENKENDNAKQQTSNTTSQSQTIATRNLVGSNTTKKQTMITSKTNVNNSSIVNHVNADNTTIMTGIEQKGNFTFVDGLLAPLSQPDDPARPFKCDVCNKSYKSKGHLKFHFKVHQIDRPFRCPFCGKGFLQKGHLRRHVLVHTEEKPYVCADCDKVFRQISHLNDHKKIHANIRPSVCHICSKGFRQTSALKRHIIRMHATQKLFECDSCDKTYRLESDLKRHQATTCNKDKPQRVRRPRKSKAPAKRRRTADMVDVEDNVESDSCNVSPEKSHQRQSQNSSPRKIFNCEICDKPCRSKADRKIHMRIHNNEKPFQCGICHNIFRQLAHLKHHMLIHTGERPYSCQHCSKAFRGNSALTRHIDRIHPVEKKFACGICTKACASEADIKRHRKSHRNEKDGIEGDNINDGGDENDAAGESPEPMDTKDSEADPGDKVVEEEKQLTGMEDPLPNAKNQLSEAETQLREVEGSLPSAGKAKVFSTVDEEQTGEESLKESANIETIEGTQDLNEGPETADTEK
ncbi:zinc finger protein 665-like [Asterias rubens]|uniref:zinc finger protein 665-like n=1 Tax=Asterias rubens TaxID=7604 RepID=UPI0014551624|nr:zinc finger protein 665-like [Asterias rubens]